MVNNDLRGKGEMNLGSMQIKIFLFPSEQQGNGN